MSVISVSNLTFYYDGSYENVFDDVSFQIDTDWRLGFIGRNGRGKTTFLRLLLGELEYVGTISKAVEFDYFPYEVRDRSKQTIEIVEEIYPAYEFWELCREWSYLKGAEDVWFRPFQTLSNGEQTKVLLAVLFLKQEHFLLIDEPTNHLDMETRQVICDYLKRKSGFILVSHDRYFLDGCINHVMSINKNNIEIVQGSFSSWWENKRRQDAFEYAENEKLKKEISRLAQSAGQAKRWADQVESTKIGKKSMKNGQKTASREYIGEKSRRMQQRRKNLENRKERELGEKSQLLKNIESSEDLKMMPAAHHRELLVSARDITLSYGQREIYKNVSFELRTGDCVVLEGKNGCGKSSLIREIIRSASDPRREGTKEEMDHTKVSGFDQESGRKCKGRLETASGLIISYVSQDTSGLKGSLQQLIVQEKINETLFKQFLRKLDFSRSHFEKHMEEMSEGQKKKVLLAKSLCEQAHIYIWDEPLNFIDIFSRMQLEELIIRCCPTMLLVEHDRSFVEHVAARIVRL